MRKLLALMVLLLGGLLAAQPLLAANPGCGGCCEDMTGKAMVQCLSMGCQACSNAPCLQITQARIQMPLVAQAGSAGREHLIPAPAAEIWTPPD